MNMKVRKDCMDKLESLGFHKGRIYYTNGLIRVHIVDRIVEISFPGHYGSMPIPDALANLIKNFYLETPSDSSI